MHLSSERGIIRLVEQDAWMMDILHTAAQLGLPDWWICAGFVRSKIWDTLHGYEEPTPLPDVDVVFFDRSCTSEETEKELEARLRLLRPEVPWSVKNQARMHAINGNPPYTSSVDAISKFPETATALGVTLGAAGHVRLAAPCGIQDALNMLVKPTPYFAEHEQMLEVYRKRVARKNWPAQWPRIEVTGI
ncbi:nucleotidyltransferase family protein [Paenibacillus pinistramenti]|uniref:nucleotidyltransferase family protein n=1 Tax=Paenibacillus pinistramenti TaxID=1768003 RepID=UPI001108C484|nr:nucleotidyltransferase family protein [Paenibacillus pinistramenti]